MVVLPTPPGRNSYYIYSEIRKLIEFLQKRVKFTNRGSTRHVLCLSCIMFSQSKKQAHKIQSQQTHRKVGIGIHVYAGFQYIYGSALTQTFSLLNRKMLPNSPWKAFATTPPCAQNKPNTSYPSMTMTTARLVGREISHIHIYIIQREQHCFDVRLITQKL